MKKKTKTTGILDELRPSEILELKLRSLYKKSGSGSELFEDLDCFKSGSCMIVGIEQ